MRARRTSTTRPSSRRRSRRRAARSATSCSTSKGPPHERHFSCAAQIDGEELGTGTGRTKKEAEQAAAKMALERTRSRLSARLAVRAAASLARVHLRSLRLRGFKSFPDPLELKLEPGVAVVVGPNGSGKSNVADAIVWAAGSLTPVGAARREAGRRALQRRRGPDGRPILRGRARLRQRDGGFGELDFSEVSIARRLHRGGEGQYLVNRAHVRRTDLVELLADVGLGGSMHSIVSQGKVEAVLASKPEERRELVEEAAGLGKFKRRRHRAELKLNRVGIQVERARDVEAEVRKRLRPLALQATAAERAEKLVGGDRRVCGRGSPSSTSPPPTRAARTPRSARPRPGSAAQARRSGSGRCSRSGTRPRRSSPTPPGGARRRSRRSTGSQGATERLALRREGAEGAAGAAARRSRRGRGGATETASMRPRRELEAGGRRGDRGRARGRGGERRRRRARPRGAGAARGAGAGDGEPAEERLDGAARASGRRSRPSSPTRREGARARRGCSTGSQRARERIASAARVRLGAARAPARRAGRDRGGGERSGPVAGRARSGCQRGDRSRARGSPRARRPARARGDRARAPGGARALAGRAGGNSAGGEGARGRGRAARALAARGRAGRRAGRRGRARVAGIALSLRAIPRRASRSCSGPARRASAASRCSSAARPRSASQTCPWCRSPTCCPRGRLP